MAPRRFKIDGYLKSTALLLLLLLLSGLSSCIHIPLFSKSPSQEFEQFVGDYFGGKFAVRADTLIKFQWLRSDHDSLSAVGATTALTTLRSIDCSVSVGRS